MHDAATTTASPESVPPPSHRPVPFVVGIGTGRCGIASLVRMLNDQPEARFTFNHVPILPATPAPTPGRPPLGLRLASIRASGPAEVVGDFSPSYLNYAEELLSVDPEVRVVCLKRPRDEVVASFKRVLDASPLPFNHWTSEPEPEWTHDPVWTRMFPQYETRDLDRCLVRYWDEYYEVAGRLAARYPDRVRIFDMATALNTADGFGDLLAHVGIPPERQVLSLGTRLNRLAEPAGALGDNGAAAEATPTPAPSPRPARRRDELDPGRCAVLVPYLGHIVPACQKGLTELERRGYAVRCLPGFSAIDQARNVMASAALIDGFEETLWIDSDIGFEPDAVDRLRAHRKPLVCGLYPKKGARQLACELPPEMEKLTFGTKGGLVPIRYCGLGFCLVRRHVYLEVQRRLGLPLCNQQFGQPIVPYFQPMSLETVFGDRYLAEDYAFCQRAHEAGHPVLADTTIRLFHVGEYHYSWEDSGTNPDRFPSFTLHLPRERTR